MKKVLRILAIVLGVVVLLVVGGIGYVKLALPQVGPAPELTVQADSAQIARGGYLANHVAVCIDCHSQRDWSRIAGPIVPGTEGKGGEPFTHDIGFPGNYYAKNLTPTHLSDWSDGEIYRAVTTGVSKDGHALFPVMPYLNYGQVDPEDIKAVIAYVRTLKPIENPSIPSSESDFPMNLIINTIPAKTAGSKRPEPADSVAYGKYVLTFAGCGECHTPVDDKGQPLPGMSMAGGRPFAMPPGVVRSANLTPDSETGIGKWTKEAFIARFKAAEKDDFKHPISLQHDEFNTVMPWRMYAGMSEQDLGAIFSYLKTVAPVKNTVTLFTPKGKEVAAR
ncbi:c-type cytochrome [Larkinella rosea]|uniref:Cytochrome C n=1 Tax=Larkinella rosea TaxID=2025312 RepID=A0A3P1BUV4_9BACT|nr:c-type cytochrome [Larkinella rosea]RRB04666.1 cytochrome C [Larkinella rosea]